jgi:hypothetical protein
MIARGWTSIATNELSDVQIRYVNEALAGQLRLESMDVEQALEGLRDDKTTVAASSPGAM